MALYGGGGYMGAEPPRAPRKSSQAVHDAEDKAKRSSTSNESRVPESAALADR